MVTTLCRAWKAASSPVACPLSLLNIPCGRCWTYSGHLFCYCSFSFFPMFLFLLASSGCGPFSGSVEESHHLDSQRFFFQWAMDCLGSRFYEDNVRLLTGGLVKLLANDINDAFSRLSWCKKHFTPMELLQQSCLCFILPAPV